MTIRKFSSTGKGRYKQETRIKLQNKLNTFVSHDLNGCAMDLEWLSINETSILEMRQ